jgi:hypothetical protein
LRFKGFHVINQPFYFDAVFAVLKPFLKDKIRRRVSKLHTYRLGNTTICNLDSILLWEILAAFYALPLPIASVLGHVDENSNQDHFFSYYCRYLIFNVFATTLQQAHQPHNVICKHEAHILYRTRYCFLPYGILI